MDNRVDELINDLFSVARKLCDTSGLLLLLRSSGDRHEFIGEILQRHAPFTGILIAHPSAQVRSGIVDHLSCVFDGSAWVRNCVFESVTRSMVLCS